MDYFEIIPFEIFKLITNELNLEDFPKLSRTNKYFNNINFALEYNIINNRNLPNFMLLNKWSNMLYLENPNFILPKTVSVPISFERLMVKIISKNLINGLKLIIDNIHLTFLPFSRDIHDFIIKNNYFICKNKNRINYINQPLLVLTLLFGTKEMLIFLLDSNIINQIDNNRIIHYYGDKNLKDLDNSQNLLTFIDNMEIKNKWQIKQLYDKISPFCIIEEIQNNNIFLVKKILTNANKDLFEKKIQYDIKNLPIEDDLKLKHLFLFVANSESIIDKIKNWFNSESLLQIIFDSFTWSDLDIKFIIEVDKEYDLGLYNRLDKN
jgi:hypothetical protein